MAFLGHFRLAFWPARRFSSRFGCPCRHANLRENRPEAPPDTLRGEAGLRLLPGKRAIFDQGTDQKEQPIGECHQCDPGIAGRGCLETGQVQAQGFFAEAYSWFNRPAVDIRFPDEPSGNHHVDG